MGRRLIAILASLILLLCATMFSGPALLHAINTDDGVSLDESVIDDLRPSALQDAPSSGALTDQLPASAWPAWAMAGRQAAWARPAMQRSLPWPYLGSPLRPPSAA